MKVTDNNLNSLLKAIGEGTQVRSGIVVMAVSLSLAASLGLKVISFSQDKPAVAKSVKILANADLVFLENKILAVEIVNQSMSRSDTLDASDLLSGLLHCAMTNLRIIPSLVSCTSPALHSDLEIVAILSEATVRSLDNGSPMNEARMLLTTIKQFVMNHAKPA